MKFKLWCKVFELEEFSIACDVISISEEMVGKQYQYAFAKPISTDKVGEQTDDSQDVADDACLVISFFKGDLLQAKLGKAIATFLTPDLYKKYQHLNNDQKNRIKEILAQGYVDLIKNKLKNYGLISESIEDKSLLEFSEALETTTHILKLPSDPFFHAAQLSKPLESTFFSVLSEISLSEELNQDNSSENNIFTL